MKNTPQKLWFRAKRYGYGWYPCTWEGWLSVAIFIILLTIGELLFINKLKQSSSLFVTTLFIVYILSITIALLYISYKKGEPAKWRWGDKK